MRVAVLYSGGKDSNLALCMALEEGYEVSCLVSVESRNKDSYMFHTPSVNGVRHQAATLGIPLVVVKTEGVKEEELSSLKEGIVRAKDEYGVEGVVTGAVESVYQASRVQKICYSLGVECFNLLWKMEQTKLLEEVIKRDMEVVLVGVFAYPFDKSWLGEKIDEGFIKRMKKLREKYKISPSGEGGEYESFVLYSPFFSERLKVAGFEDLSEGENSHRREVKIG